jgi:hypothetical protein
MVDDKSQRLTGGTGEVRGDGAPGVLCSWIGGGKKKKSGRRAVVVGGRLVA